MLLSAAEGLSSGQTVTKAIDFVGDVDTFTITAQAGDDLLVSFSELKTGSPGMEVEVRAPDSTLLASASNDSAENLEALNLAQSGTYTIVVSDTSGDDTYSYALTAVVVDNTIDTDNVALTSGATVTDTIALGDIDTFTITAQAGDDLLVSYAELGPSSPGMEVDIYAPNSTLLVSDSNDSADNLEALNLAVSGTYTIVVRDTGADGTYDYNLTAVVVDNTIDSGNVALTSGATATDTFVLGDIDTFTITAQAGDDLLVSYAELGPSSPGMEVDIYAPDSTLLTSASNDGAENLEALNLATSGTYTIVVRDTGADASYDYNLTAVVVDNTLDSDNVALTSGATETATIALGDIDTFTITAQAGDDLLVSYSELISGSPGMEVDIYAPDTTLLTSASNDSAENMEALNLATSGTYTIVVRDTNANGTYDYNLTAVVVDNTLDSDNVALTSGATVTDTFVLGDIDTFTITAQAGDDLLVSYSELISGSPGMEVDIYAPNSTLLTSASNDSAENLEALNLATSGTYTIVVRDTSANGTYDYNLTAVVVDNTIDSGNVALTSGATVTDTFVLGDIDTFTITAQAGDDLLVSYSELISGSPGMEVDIYAPDSTLLTSASNDSAENLEALNLATSGTYTIVVRDTSANGTYDYNLTAVVVDNTIDSGNVVLTSGVKVNSTIDLGDIDTFTISAQAGDDLFVNYSELASGSPGMEVDIYAPDSTLILSRSNDGAENLEALGLTTSGTYTIVVRDTGADGAYDYEITATATAPQVPPIIATDNGSVSVSEGATAMNTGTVTPTNGDAVMLSASVGNVTDNGDGTWSWSFDTTDGPDESQTVTITATDNDGSSETTFTLTVNNMTPTVAADAPTVSKDEGQTATNTGTYSDAGNDTISLSASVGIVTDNGNGTWSWSFAASDGPDDSQTVTITATDSDGAAGQVMFDLTVSNVGPSVAADNGSTSISEGQTAANTGTYSDPGNDTVILSASVGNVTDNGNGTWSWSFDTTDGPDDTQTVTITATDSDGAASEVMFNLTVNNAAPSVASNSASVSVDEGQTAANTGTYSDAGDDTVTLSASVGTVTDNGDGTWAWSFNTTDTGDSQSVTITATDSDGAMATVNFSLVVGNAQTPPLISAGNLAVNVGEGQTAVNTGTVTPTDGDPVALTASIGIVTDNGDGTWSWSFDTSDGPDDSQTVTITATDDEGSTEATFNLVVNNVAPSVTADSATVTANEGQTAANTGAYSDAGDDTVVLTASVGTVTDHGDGTWSWSFGASDGPDDSQTVTITATDSDGAANQVMFALTVNNVAPSIASNSASVAVDEGQTAANQGTFSDPGDDTVALTASVGTVIDNGDGTWSWSFDTTTSADTQTVTITATDSDGAMSATMFNLVVGDAEIPPTIASDSGSITVDEGQTAANTGTVTPTNGDAFTLAASIGTVTDNGDGTWSWSFDATDGPDESQLVTITATDNDGSNETSFNLTVNNVAPTVASVSATVTVTAGQVAMNSGSYGDPGADTVMLTASVGIVTDNGDGTWSWSFATGTPADSQAVTITATDSDNAMSTTPFNLVVSAAATIGDTVFIDGNNNGMQDLGEVGLSGVVVTLWEDTDANGSYETSRGQRTTNASGVYDFTLLTAGAYRVSVDTGQTALNGFAATTPVDVDLTLSDGEDFNDADFGVLPTSTSTAAIGNLVFSDVNANGVQDAGEPGVPGVAITLVDAITSQDLVTVTSDAQGAYQFSGLAAGDYVVRFDTTATTPSASGLAFTSPNQGDDDTLDSDAIGASLGIAETGVITLAEGEQNLTIDAGLLLPQIAVSIDGVDLVSGAAVADLGTALLYGSSVDVTITVRNDGVGPLFLGELILPGGFAIDASDTLVDTLAPSQSDTFTVVLPSSGLGQFSGNLLIPSNDPDAQDSPFAIALTGKVDTSRRFKFDRGFGRFRPVARGNSRVEVREIAGGRRVVEMAEGSDPSIELDTLLPPTVTNMSFQYLFTQAGIDDTLQVIVTPEGGESQTIAMFASQDFAGTDFVSTGPIDLSAFAGQQVTIEIRLATNDPVDSIVQIDDILIESELNDTVLADSRGNVQYVDAEGNEVTVSLKGAGQLQVLRPSGTGDDLSTPADAVRFVVTGSDAKSSLTIKTKADRNVAGSTGVTRVADIEVDGPIGKIEGKSTDLLGDMTTRPIKSIKLRNVADDHNIFIDNAGASAKDSVSIELGAITDLVLTSLLPIKSFKAISWTDTNPTIVSDAIIAPSLGKLEIKGDKKAGDAGAFQADIMVDGTDPRAKSSVGSVKIAGPVAFATANIIGDVGALAFGSTVTDSSFTATGNVKKLDSKGALNNIALEFGEFGAIKVASWDSGSLVAAFGKSIETKGDKKASDDGDMANVSLTFTGIAAGSKAKEAISKIKVAGSATHTNIDVQADAAGAIEVKNATTDSTLNFAAAVKSFKLGDVHDTSATAGSTGSIDVIRWLGGDITLLDVKSIKTKGTRSEAGDFMPTSVSLNASGTSAAKTALGSASIKGALSGAWLVAGVTGASKDSAAGKVSADAVAAGFIATFMGDVGSLASKSIFDGFAAAFTFGKVDIKTNMNGATIIAGGGVPGSSNTIGTFKVGGDVTNGTRVLVGVDDVNGVFDDGDDQFKPGDANFVKSISIGGQAAADSVFRAGRFPTSVTINHAKVDPQNDPRFLVN